MDKKILTYVALAAGLLFMQCSDKPTEPEQQIKLGELFTLSAGKTVQIQGEDISLAFRNVLSDSRCPFSVMCFREGVAEIEVKLSTKAGDSALVSLGVLGGARDNVEDPYFVDTLGYRLSLLRLDPYPETSGNFRLTTPPVPLSEYQATMVLTHSTNQQSLVEKVTITDMPPESIQIGHFGIDTMSIAGDTLDLVVSYGGGCKNHYFFLFMSPAVFAESIPVQANLWLRHFDNDDSCKCDGGKCYNHRKLRFDLTPIAELYRQLYGGIGPIAVNISGYAGQQPEETFRKVYYPEGSQRNRAPQLTSIEPKSVHESDTLQFTIGAVDPDGTTPTLNAIGLLSHAGFVDHGNGTGAFLFAPDTNQAGEHQIIFIASDGELADSEMVAIEVEDVPPAVNHAPVLAEIGPKSVECGDTLRFAIPAIDPDGTIPSVFAVNLPRNASLMTTDSGSAIFWFSPDTSQVGVHNVLFYATDGELADSEVVAVTVTSSSEHPPMLQSIVAICGEAGSSVSFVVFATDEDETAPVLTATNLPEHADFVDSGNGRGVFIFDSDTSQHATFVITFVASDGRFSNSEEVTIILYSQEMMSSALIPMAVGNYWVYQAADGGGATDSTCVVGNRILDGQLFWTLSDPELIGDHVRVTADSLFNEYGLQFSVSSDSSSRFAATGVRRCALSPVKGDRLMFRVDTTITVPAGTFSKCYKFTKQYGEMYDYGTYYFGWQYFEEYYIAVGVGIVYVGCAYYTETLPHAPLYMANPAVLVRYNVK